MWELYINKFARMNISMPQPVATASTNSNSENERSVSSYKSPGLKAQGFVVAQIMLSLFSQPSGVQLLCT